MTRSVAPPILPADFLVNVISDNIRYSGYDIFVGITRGKSDWEVSGAGLRLRQLDYARLVNTIEKQAAART